MELDGYRANSVAFALAWLAEQSRRRMDLAWIWENQRVSPALNEALKTVCAAAHEYILENGPRFGRGNVNEGTKKVECWAGFKEKELSEPPAWRDELSDTEFVLPSTEEESLATEWERIRQKFAGDSRTIGELEALTGKVWMPTRGRDPVYFYAEKSGEQLRAEKLRGNQKLGLKSLRGLVELVSAAVAN